MAWMEYQTVCEHLCILHLVSVDWYALKKQLLAIQAHQTQSNFFLKQNATSAAKKLFI